MRGREWKPAFGEALRLGRIGVLAQRSRLDHVAGEGGRPRIVDDRGAERGLSQQLDGVLVLGLRAEPDQIGDRDRGPVGHRGLVVQRRTVLVRRAVLVLVARGRRFLVAPDPQTRGDLRIGAVQRPPVFQHLPPAEMAELRFAAGGFFFLLRSRRGRSGTACRWNRSGGRRSGSARRARSARSWWRAHWAWRRRSGRRPSAPMARTAARPVAVRSAAAPRPRGSILNDPAATRVAITVARIAVSVPQPARRSFGGGIVRN